MVGVINRLLTNERLFVILSISTINITYKEIFSFDKTNKYSKSQQVGKKAFDMEMPECGACHGTDFMT